MLLVGRRGQERDFLEQIINDSCGCTTDSATTVSGAVLKMDHESFDLVLADLSLPDGDGKWLLQKIRQQQPGAGIIVLSDERSAQSVLEAVRAGADDFLARPLDAEKVIERIKHLLERTGQNRRNQRWRRRTAVHLKRLRNRRRRLAEQVELVCQDLVGGYRRTVEKLLELQSRQTCREAIEGQLEMKPLLGSVLRYLSDTFSAASGAVFLSPMGQARARLFTPIGGGPPGSVEDYDRILTEGLIERSLEAGVPMIGSYGQESGQAECGQSSGDSEAGDPNPDDDCQLANRPARSLLASGLYLQRRVIGAVVLQRKGHNPFTRPEAKLLAGLAGPIARAINLVLRLEANTASQGEKDLER